MRGPKRRPSDVARRSRRGAAGGRAASVICFQGGLNEYRLGGRGPAGTRSTTLRVMGTRLTPARPAPQKAVLM